jgi:anti-sigma regulatory factor (Ser/Thr protein kinase)
VKKVFEHRIPADLSLVGDLRRLLRHGLEQAGVSCGFIERLVLVVDEVVSNSIEHGAGYRKSAAPIRVVVRQRVDGLQVEVDDLDVPVDLVTTLEAELHGQDGMPPSAVSERGRGMFLITMLLTDLRVVAVEGGGMRVQGRLLEVGD